jgi:hypothetical protein
MEFFMRRMLLSLTLTATLLAAHAPLAQAAAPEVVTVAAGSAEGTMSNPWRPSRLGFEAAAMPRDAEVGVVRPDPMILALWTCMPTFALELLAIGGLSGALPGWTGVFALVGFVLPIATIVPGYEMAGEVDRGFGVMMNGYGLALLSAVGLGAAYGLATGGGFMGSNFVAGGLIGFVLVNNAVALWAANDVYQRAASRPSDY